MKINLKGRSFLTLMDFSKDEIRYMLDLAHELKAKKKAGIIDYKLKGKNVVLLFEKTSTRTRCSFEVSCLDEGAHVTYLDSGSSQMGKKESLEDTAKVLGRFYDAIEYRGYEQKVLEDLSKFSEVPVWNGLSDVDHPTQILADMMTMEEHMSKPLNEAKVVFCGDIRNNMSYAWMYGCAKMGMHYVAYGPDSLKVDEEVLGKVENAAKESGAIIEISSDPKCLKGADVIYTDIWASMGEEDKIAERVKLLSPYKVTMDLIKATENPNVIFMHCLPAFHDFETTVAKKCFEKGLDIREVSDEVFRSKYSVVFDEAENRLHSIKAVVVATLG
ncbi:ornithine carbamoyltransferase [Anaerovorax odorimutans]|uniref:ornithine carbamoyltransferase n=1 Tax=Anaerovorax odorimutans TaxID=109327 RepID=UPI00041FC160|nr:ornithine carbamoyltransferase [Anaerovorax odorimutans]